MSHIHCIWLPAFYNMCQKPEDTNTQYLEQFNNTIDVLEQYGGTLGNDDDLKADDTEDEYGSAGDEESKDDRATWKTLKRLAADR